LWGLSLGGAGVAITIALGVGLGVGLQPAAAPPTRLGSVGFE
jgi:hypothetical protein